MNHEKNNLGFTLIELLVVVAIISLLTSVVLAQLTDARKKAIDAKILAEYQQLQTALEIYYNENGKYPSPNGPESYCISDSADDCSIAGVPVNLTLNQGLETALNFPPVQTSPKNLSNLLAAALFTYKPGASYSIDGNKGFVYKVFQYGGPEPMIILTTHKTGVVNATVGVWTLSEGSGS